MNRTVVFFVLLAALLACGRGPESSDAIILPTQDRQFEDTQRVVEDNLWHFRLDDVANIDRFEITSSQPRRVNDPKDRRAGQPLIIPVYVFSPKNLQAKAPLLIFAHGGVHGRVTPDHTHIFREGLERGYVIVAPEFRGSTGHGPDLYDQIDYGGAEVHDTHDARNWAVENLPFVDPERVAIFGWSHGGLQALMNVFHWPEDYQAAYAGVPVSDLVARMGYMEKGYREMFAGFIGKKLEEDMMEYRRRSPVFHAKKLQTPLLIHATTNDEDVHIVEIENLIAALNAAGKKFESRIYQNAPGGHRFNRIDTKLARESRQEMWDFLARNLK